MSHSNEVTSENEPKRFEPFTFFCRTLICERIKLVVVSIVVFLLILVVFIGIANNYCVLQIHPVANFILLFLALTLLAYCEALHYAVVAVEKWDMSVHQERFPRAYKTYKLVDTATKVKKFLVGRQFFVIFVVFLISQITSFPNIPQNFGGMPPVLVTVLFQIGIPGVALVLTFGQLVSQIFVEEFTLQFLNLYGNEFVVRIALAAEYIGICHFSWLLYKVVSLIACRSVLEVQRSMNSTDALIDAEQAVTTRPTSPTVINRGPDYDSGMDEDKKLGWWDYIRYTWSTVATLGSLVIILYGIYRKVYVLPTDVGTTYIVFFLALTVLFYLEGLMIAIVATQYWDKETFKEVYPRAYKVHELVNRPDNVKRFIIGRQFCTVLTNFMLGQVSTLHHFPSDGYNKVLFYIIVQSGLVGVMVVLAFAQLCPELLAAEFPLRFMNLPFSYTVVWVSLIFDNIGVGHCAWAVYYSLRSFVCRGHISNEHGEAVAQTKPTIIKVNSAEIIAATNASQKNGVTSPRSSGKN